MFKFLDQTYLIPIYKLSSEIPTPSEKSTAKMVCMIRSKTIKDSWKGKWTDRQYHIQDNYDVAHQYVRIYCITNQSPSLPFYGPHSKPHDARGLSKH